MIKALSDELEVHGLRGRIEEEKNEKKTIILSGFAVAVTLTACSKEKQKMKITFG